MPILPDEILDYMKAALIMNEDDFKNKIAAIESTEKDLAGAIRQLRLLFIPPDEKCPSLFQLSKKILSTPEARKQPDNLAANHNPHR